MTFALWIDDSGATDDEIRRGVAAAEAVFQQRGIDPAAAHDADQRASHDDKLTPEQELALAAWQEADRAAVRACCAGWRQIPDAAHLTRA